MRGVRVLEVAGSTAAAYAGRLFTATGADVVLVEPPHGAPARHTGPTVAGPTGVIRARHEHLDAGKRSAVVDLAGPDGDALLAWADVVLVTVDGDPGVAMRLRDRVRVLQPAGVVVAVSGFGLTGPYASWRSSPLVEWASGGYLYLNGEPDREPLQGGGAWASHVVGATAAVGAAAGVLHAARTGEGQLVDVGAMEATAAGHQWTLTMFTHTGVVKRRWGLRLGESFHPMCLYRCADGAFVSICAASREQWERLCLTLEAPELLVEEDLYAPAARFERADHVDAAFEPWLSTHTADEAVDALQANRVPASRAQDFVEVLHSEHLAARDAFVERPDLAPGARMPALPLRLDPGPVPVRSAQPAPVLGAHTEVVLDAARAVRAGTVPARAFPAIDLTAVRVVECSIAWAGPLAGRTLADLGAQVVKIEHPASRGLGTTGRASQIGGKAGWERGMLPDPQIRAEIFPDADPGAQWWNRMGVWNKMNRGKASLCLDAKPAAGRAVLEALVAQADVVLHNYTPRGAASLGIDAASLAPVNGRLVTVAMTGYGETGPMASHSSYGPVLEAYAGFDEATGYPGEGPMRLGIAFPDAVGGVHGAYAVLAGLWERACTGSAVHVDLSQLETLLAIAADDVLAASITGTAPARHGNRSVDGAPQGVYRCVGDDRWVAVSVTDEAAWSGLVGLLGAALPVPWRDLDPAGRQALHDELDAVVAVWTGTRTAAAAAAELQAVGVAACPVFTNGDLVDDPHLAARGFIVTWDQAGVGPARFPGYPIHFEHRRPEVRGAPALGADNVAILRRLGWDDDAVAALHAAGVLATAPPG